MILLDEPTERLCAGILSGAVSPVRLAIVAPGGYGKSAVLAHLSGADVRVVDDAHLLGDAELADLARYLDEDERAGLVIATRPHARRTALNQVLARLNGQVVLRPFDVARTAKFLHAIGSGEHAELVHAQTGGVPGLVRAVADLASLRHEFDHAGEDVLRFLLAAESGAGADLAGGAAVVEAAHATGLLTSEGRLLPIAVRALRELIPRDRQLALRRQLVEQQLERGGPVLRLVEPLVDAGLTGHEIGAAFEAAATEADPATAVRLYEAAAKAGRPVGARRAEAQARAGDFDAALRLADELLASGDETDRTEGARIAGTALAHRGQLDRSAELFQWAGPGAQCFAAIGLVGTGRLDDARAALAKCGGDGPPTLLSGAVSGAARGIVESVTEQSPVALSTLVRAAEVLEPVSAGLLLPDTPAALAALVALHGGEAVIAEPLLERAVEAGQLTARHRLLLAWIAMLRGDQEQATRRLRAAGDDLSPRDWLFAVGLRVGLARRASDLAVLRRIWGQAREAVIRHPVDLFTFLPFGEFEVAAARLGERDRLAPHLSQARALLSALGEPPLWGTALHWSGLHAAILDEQPGEAAEHVAALAATASAGPYFAVMSEAADNWLKVLNGDVDPPAVEAAARGLHGVGLCWDGARLAGQAAIRTSDRKAMVTLLDCARVLQGREPAAGEKPTRLSDRERQVAELVLAGLTYKQIGDRLFISAKTVEHHVARMRQRLGAGSRSELLSELRAELEPAQGTT